MSQPKATQINNEMPLPAVLLQMITGRWVSQVIYVAAKLATLSLIEGVKHK